MHVVDTNVAPPQKVASPAPRTAPGGRPPATGGIRPALQTPGQWLTWRAVFVGMMVLHLVPLWVVWYFPSQDGPVHLYNARILLDGLDPANFQLRQVYTWNYALHPNMLSNLLLAGLLQLVGPLVAEKIVLSLLVGLLPLSMLYVIRAFGRGGEVFSLGGFLFAYHNLLHLGFYNFCLGVSICLFALGFWWRYRDRMTVRRLGSLYVLILLTYVAHFAAFSVLLVTITVALFWTLALRTVHSMGRYARGLLPGSDFRREARAHLVWSMSTLGYLLPAAAMAWDFYFGTRRLENESYRTMPELIDMAARTLTLVSYSDWHRGITPFVLLVIGAAVAATLLHRRGRQPLFQERDALPITCGILLWLYFTLPWSANGAWVNDRLYIMAAVIAFTWFGPVRATAGMALGTALVVLSLLHTGRLTYDYVRLQPDLARFYAIGNRIEPHSTLKFDRYQSAHPAAFPEGTRLVDPLRHAFSYAGHGARDVALLSNYQAAKTFFLTSWHEPAGENADYVVVWGYAADDIYLSRYESHYDLAHADQNVLLYRLKRTPPTFASWTRLDDDRHVLRLRMMRQRGHNTDALPVARDRLFVSGSWGWVNNVPRDEWRGRDAAAVFGDLAGDVRTRALRVDLPNGRYRVTCHFVSHPEGRYEVNVIANDRAVAEGLVVERDASPRSIQFTVEVTDGQLTQVFFTTWRRSVDPHRLDVWALSGVEIEQQ